MPKRSGEVTRLLALIAEIAVFALIAENFFTLGNFFEVIRTSVEVGLLAIALTPILVTGGIDLSVGSMMGLAAVVFGAALRDWKFGVGGAAIVALLVGCAGGMLNAALIARFRIPPLIETLGSYSMFRGIAEGITRGATNYSGFPAGFLFLGQGYLWGVVPAQLPVFVVVLAAYVVLLHRSAIGRALYAIGFAPAGARYAGIPVAKRVGLVYFLSGLISSAAAIIYVAHLGQAKSSAGIGYELDAITAVVLGGTSVFGGRGTLAGTLLGLFSLSVLQNGLRLAALPSELSGVLTGALLVITISIDRLRSRRGPTRAEHSILDNGLPMKNSQLAILCGTILAGSLIVAGTNVWLVRTVGSAPAFAGAQPAAGHRPVIAVMPKAKGDPYFVSCRKRCGGSRSRIGDRSDLGWPDRARRRETKRDRGELDHAAGGRHRRSGGESGRHFDRAS